MSSENENRKKKQQRGRKAREEWLPGLIKQYPQAFFEDARERKPLKIGIHKDILADEENSLSNYQLTSALRWYTGALGYQKTLMPGAKRIDLAGEEVGEVSEKDAEAAKGQVKAIREKMKSAKEEKNAEERAERWMQKLSKLTG